MGEVRQRGTSTGAVIPPRFLIDENLSPSLVASAHNRGFEAMHVNHLGLRTDADWELLKIVYEQEWVLVTNNAVEFRGRYREIELHPGVVFLIPAVRRSEQLQLFEVALDYLQNDCDVVNCAFDVLFGPDRLPVVRRYELP